MYFLNRTYTVTDGLTVWEALARVAFSIVIVNAAGAYMLVRIGANDPPANAASADRVLPPYSAARIPTTSTLFGYRWTTTPNGVSGTNSKNLGTAQVNYGTDQVQEEVTALPSAATREGTVERFTWRHTQIVMAAGVPVVVWTAPENTYLVAARLRPLARPARVPVATRLLLYTDNASSPSDSHVLDMRLVLTTDDLQDPLNWLAPTVERGIYLPAGYRLMAETFDDDIDLAFVSWQTAQATP